jgi:hypothetical protein
VVWSAALISFKFRLYSSWLGVAFWNAVNISAAVDAAVSPDGFSLENTRETKSTAVRRHLETVPC